MKKYYIIITLYMTLCTNMYYIIYCYSFTVLDNDILYTHIYSHNYMQISIYSCQLL